MKTMSIRRLWATELVKWCIPVGLLLTYLIFLSLIAVGTRDLGNTLELQFRTMVTLIIWLLITKPARGVSAWLCFWVLVVGTMVLPITSAVIALPGTIVLGETASYLVVPFVEEATKMLPLIMLLVLSSHVLRAGLSAVDLAILGLACGLGFSLAEEMVRGRSLTFASGFGLPGLFPIATSVGVGHGVWTGLAGLGLGTSLMFGKRLRRWKWLPFVLTGALAVWEHAGFNLGTTYGRGAPGWWQFAYGTLTREGQLSEYLFGFGTFAAIAGGLFLTFARRNALPDLRPRLRVLGQGPIWHRLLLTSWAFSTYLCLRTAAGVAVVRYRGATARREETIRLLMACGTMKELIENDLPWETSVQTE